jgi:hypothetical protein
MIKNVAAHQIGGHSQMIANQKTNRVSFFGPEIQTRENSFDCLQASDYVVFAGHALAGVMKEKRKE